MKRPQSTPSSADKPLIEDVLPSFEMHDYMFNRSVYDDPSDSSPPEYTEASDTSSADSVCDSQNTVPETAPFEETDRLLLSKLDKLDRVDVPIEIHIVITTKNQTFTGSEPPTTAHLVEESPFREYKPGDIVTGYITVQSHDSKPVTFDTFIFSLNGYAGVPGMQTIHFLRMLDLAACYQPSSTAIVSDISCGTIDVSDGSVFGLPEQILLPEVCYKKRFTFVMPHFLLDSACPYQLERHIKIPPSFGSDSYHLEGIGAALKASPILGFSRASKGNLIAARDFAGSFSYISYSINAELIGTVQHAKPVNFVILQRDQQFFRVSTADCVIPDLMEPTSTQLKQFDGMIEQSLAEMRSNFQVPVPPPVPKLPDKRQAQLQARMYKVPPKGPPVHTPLPIFETIQIGTISKGILKGHSNIRVRARVPTGLSFPSTHPDCFFTTNLHSGTTSPCDYLSAYKSSVGSSSCCTSFSSCPSSAFAPDEIELHLEYSHPDITRRPPTKISTSLALKLIDIQCRSSLPVTFDPEFFIQSDFEDLKTIYQAKFDTMKQLASDTDCQVPASILTGLHALKGMHKTERTIKSFFKPTSNSPEWRFDVDSRSYSATIKVPLQVSKTAIKEKYHMPPSFETCHLGRWYQVVMAIGKTSIEVTLPVQSI